jgi:hypothetical protein
VSILTVMTDTSAVVSACHLIFNGLSLPMVND